MSIYAVDFDGTLCENLYPKIGNAKQEIIDKIIELKNQGNEIILWTCRTGEYLDDAIEWCEEKSLKFDAINENIERIKEEYEEDSRKVTADYYLDDKALTLNEFMEKEVSNKMSKILQFKNKDEKTGEIKNTGRMEIKNQGEEKAELFFYGDIVSSTWMSYWEEEDKCPQDVADFLKELDNYKNVDIYINSGGGSVHGGLAIYNQLKRHQGFKTVYVDGIAASIASVIAMAGDKIVIPANAQFMIHKPLTWCGGNSDDFKKVIDILDTCQKSITAIYMENVKPGVTEEQITELINNETWWTGIEAAEYFNIDVEERADLVACASNYFNQYKNTPSNLLNKEKVNVNDVANKVKNILDKEQKENEEKEIEDILEDLDLYGF